jgi:acyl-CoA carboxylase epsilon subunit-like protein
VTELRITHGGTPSDEEIAAVVAALSTRRQSSSASDAPSSRLSLSPWVASGLVKGTRTKV